MARILIIDDDPAIRKLLSEIIQTMGHEVADRDTLENGIHEARTGTYDIVFLDVMLPDGSGLEAISKIRETPSMPDVIIITGHGDADGAEAAIKSGAWDYIQKKFTPTDILLPLRRIVQHREELKKARNPVKALRVRGIVGKSPRMMACYDLLAHAAASSINVLITGETGTGKEVFSRAIHNNSNRSENRFVVVDCAALPETLVESVLFGHVKGAYTGADYSREGLAKLADQGTLFLDEVGELALSVQKSFLRVLQEHCFRPVGGKQEVQSDFRLVAATNRDLEQMVKEGKFRKDLLYRLQSLIINLPPLRERREDIVDIAMFYLQKLCNMNNAGMKGFSPEYIEALKKYTWPGNVRELINAVDTSLANALHEQTLLPIHLPIQVRIQATRASINNNEPYPDRPNPVEAPSAGPLRFRENMDQAERKYLLELILKTGGNMKDCCRISGLSRSRLYTLFKKHDISR